MGSPSGLVVESSAGLHRFVPEVVMGIGAYHGRVFVGSARLAGTYPRERRTNRGRVPRGPVTIRATESSVRVSIGRS